MKTLVEMELDDAKRDRSMEVWKSTLQQSAICEVDLLEQVRAEFRQSDEGRLLTGIGREGEVCFFAIPVYAENGAMRYVKEW